MTFGCRIDTISEGNMKIFFCADGRNEIAAQSLRACIKRYGQAELAQAEVVVVLGGDGFMLKTLQALLNYQTPVFGLNFGHVGYLLNHYAPDDPLPDRICKADQLKWTPLEVNAETFLGKPVQNYAFNDFSLMRQNPQAARLSVNITDEKNQNIVSETVFGDGIIVATPMGSHGYYASAQGKPLPIQGGVIGVKGVCCKQDFNPIVSDLSQISVAPQEPEKRPIHLDCDGKTRFSNIAVATIHAAPAKAQTLLVERGKERF